MRYRVIFTDGTTKIANVDVTFEGKAVKTAELIEDTLQVMELKNEINRLENTRDALMKEIKILRNRELEENKRKQYGKYKNHYKWDLAKNWFNMSNDEFFQIYGFSWTPHNEKGLYDECRLFLGKGIGINAMDIYGGIRVDDAAKMINKGMEEIRNRMRK